MSNPTGKNQYSGGSGKKSSGMMDPRKMSQAQFHSAYPGTKAAKPKPSVQPRMRVKTVGERQAARKTAMRRNPGTDSSWYSM